MFIFLSFHVFLIFYYFLYLYIQDQDVLIHIALHYNSLLDIFRPNFSTLSLHLDSRTSARCMHHVPCYRSLDVCMYVLCIIISSLNQPYGDAWE